MKKSSKSKKTNTKTHKYISRTKSKSGAWRYIYDTVKHDLLRDKEQRRKEREEKRKKKPTAQSTAHAANATTTLANAIFGKKGESTWDKDKKSYLKKCINDAKTYIKDWYKKPQQDEHDHVINTQASFDLIKKAKKIKDMIFKV